MSTYHNSIRYNTKKITPQITDAVAWEHSATFTKQSSFINDPLWHAGCYYVQDSNSMFVGYIFEQLQLKEQRLTILDACAAPGGKSTHILSKINEQSLLIANELIPKRNAILQENCIRWGYPNLIITQNNTEEFSSLTNFFDCIVVDAPCSGEGLLKKNPKAAVALTEQNIQACAIRQTAILDSLMPALKHGGYLIYSTCTFQEEENEAQINYLLKNGFALVPIDSTPFKEISNGKLAHTYYFTTAETKGSGFFVACLKKLETADTKQLLQIKSNIKNRITQTKAIESRMYIQHPDNYNYYSLKYKIVAFPSLFSSVLNSIIDTLYITYFGIAAGEVKKNIFIPEHALSLSIIIQPECSYIEVDQQQAIQYLKKLDMSYFNKISFAAYNNWYLVRYQQHNLGWVKLLPNRINNYLPNNWRILKQ